ncbi:MAG: PQQ-binding-like beta-propeller repeat protein [Lentisphaerae bacterium]|jgi:outer membrane protein assembly factor BamB|nr:PQQ-binding-like beta-propeller repeat protein [Lentisphaerota bacterium]MBT4817933.1 PQQ-binding-like beta-propeller repeat protein [Lentisphaerota bacterium]MBT5613051.1 PQQ-binding-like beta-propeller repeat protein [Lentisphaerota bacterium]MBT7053978.1 PQQ-binding-like beta-propeller repeat protein [Lentisphaerota bacterium]MBT7843779.1 PQQ-binding-like beta-propeller repeat protein [Lentisphaerota bacterium]
MLTRHGFASGRLVSRLCALVVLSRCLCVGQPVDVSAAGMIAATGVRGGLAVLVGFRDSGLAIALGRRKGFLVQVLDADPAQVGLARADIQAAGLSDEISADTLNGGSLPYADGLVNLLVLASSEAVVEGELMRVLCPKGVAYVRRGEVWGVVRKPWPSTIDEWTHALYDASNNAVAADELVGPPAQAQWVCGPQWARSHDHLASVSVAVSAGGRLFYIVDGGPISAVVLPPKWALVGRDAFSGVQLWRRPMGEWEWHLRGFRSGPTELARTLVAAEDILFVTLGYGDAVAQLDAATGETMREYPGTEGTVEIVHEGGVLYLVLGRRARASSDRSLAPWRRGVTPRVHAKRVTAIRVSDGKQLWERSGADVAEVMPMTLAVADGRVFLQNQDALICLDAASGKPHWRAPRPVSTKRRGWSTPTVVVYRDVVLSADRAAGGRGEGSTDQQSAVEWEPNSAGGNAPHGELIAFSVSDGRRLWSSPCQEGYNSPVDVLVADGLVWSGELVRAKQPGITVGRDPLTGEIKRTRPPDKEYYTVGMNHHRCYRNRATSRYLVLGRAGVEFVDVVTGDAVASHWVRGVCQYGVLPCNGLLYSPPHSCACYIDAKLSGFWAHAARPTEQRVSQPVDSAVRAQRGPAYGSPAAAEPLATGAGGDWPTFRHDSSRSGRGTGDLGTELTEAWSVGLGGRLSSPVMAGGRVLVAQVDAHTVHALDSEGGRAAWEFVAGGRVDSPPTVYQGMVLFGCSDGWVYCLRAADGVLRWRFRAAPFERHIVSYGQIESTWPVHGSILIESGVAYCVAGRSSYIDGGMILYRLDPVTGAVLGHTPVDSRDPETGRERRTAIRRTAMTGALPDVLSSDGQSVFMRHVRFDLEGKPQKSDVMHLYSPAGFLDDSWWHRTYWMIGSTMGNAYGGWPGMGMRNPAGRLLVVDGEMVYGFGRDLYAHYGGHVGLDSSTIYHYGNRKREAPPPRWTYSRLFAAEKPAQKRRTPSHVRTAASCIGIDRAPSLDPSKKPITVEAWVKPEGRDGVIVARGAYTHGYSLYVKKGIPRFAIRVNSKLHEVRGVEELPADWTHLAGVLTSGKELQVYINGVLSGTASSPGFVTSDPGELMEIGADDSKHVGDYASPFPFIGLIDEVGVYQRALGSEEIRTRWQRAGVPPTRDGLALYYSFDHGDARDDSGNGNDGTVEGAVPAGGRAGGAMRFKGGLLSKSSRSTGRFTWNRRAPIAIRAMVLVVPDAADPQSGSEGALFLAGTGNHRELNEPADDADPIMHDVAAPYAGAHADRGAMLWRVSPRDGEKLAEWKLNSLPVFDGMIATGDSLYMTTQSGRVVCMRSR